jgi:hypothetical protein
MYDSVSRYAETSCKAPEDIRSPHEAYAQHMHRTRKGHSTVQTDQKSEYRTQPDVKLGLSDLTAEISGYMNGHISLQIAL